jgi:hypothetical protein
MPTLFPVRQTLSLNFKEYDQLPNISAHISVMNGVIEYFEKRRKRKKRTHPSRTNMVKAPKELLVCWFHHPKCSMGRNVFIMLNLLFRTMLSVFAETG